MDQDNSSFLARCLPPPVNPSHDRFKVGSTMFERQTFGCSHYCSCQALDSFHLGLSPKVTQHSPPLALRLNSALLDDGRWCPSPWRNSPLAAWALQSTSIPPGSPFSLTFWALVLWDGFSILLPTDCPVKWENTAQLPSRWGSFVYLSSKCF